ncbi:MAG: electron transfer flavoprotein subunit beta/FixA family protein [Solirubrobacterales bacterium]
MKLAVCVKQVATLDDEFELDDGVLDAELEPELNEWDDFSLEAALLLREQAAEGGEVVAITVGDADAEEVLRECLARGADRTVRVWDPALDAGDVLAVAASLAAALEREGPDLVLCGVQSSDAANGATGIAVAGILGVPHVAVVRSLEYDEDGRSLTVRRELEGGTVELLRLRLPALLTIQTGINKPRYANLRAIKQAREKPLEVVSLSDLGLAGGALPRAAGSRRLGRPQSGAGAQMLEGSAAELAGRIREIVEERMSS